MSVNHTIMVEDELCGTCVHYHQHYTLGYAGKFWPLWFGHCGVPRIRHRAPNDTCPHWESNQVPKKSTKPD